jgi:hypothetical protein
MQLPGLLSKYRLLLLLLFLVLLRLPSINRPVSKHHEFNTAVILINTESWDQAEGGKAFNYTPLLNYQGSSNHPLEKGAHLDAKGNHVYLSFGAGWYVLPWFVFKSFSLSFTPLNLRILSIIAGLLTVLLLYRLIWVATADKRIAFSSTAIFSLLPAPLWYCGIGYVTTAIMLPFVIGMLLAWQKIEKSRDIRKTLPIAQLIGCGLITCYFDWSGVFLLASFGLWSLLNSFKNRNFLIVAILSFIAAISGVLLVLWQFASYLGWEQVLSYWKSRFTDRSSGNGEMPFFTMVLYIGKNIITGFLPLAIVIYFGFKKSTYKTIHLKASWTFWALAAALFYNLLFFNWSALHEFAWMLPGMLLVIFLAVNFFKRLPAKALKGITSATILFSLVIYYIINLPGEKSISGDRYDSRQKTAEIIRSKVNDSIPVFINTNADKILEYYCKRTFTSAGNLREAFKVAGEFGIKHSAFLTVEDGRLKKITFINR